ncbi:MAG: hypothetical protein IKR83_04865 [Bacteroidales bacterium]|nr:hypothetical protein [Bacteroidales bacterium]
MTRRTLITLLLFVVAIGGALAWKYWPRTVPWEECSALYRQYAHADGIEATFLRGYRVNDTLAIDVTLLQATDSAGWDTICNKFNLTLQYHAAGTKPIENGEDILELWKDKEQNIISVASHRDKYICHFHTDNQQFKDAVTDAVLSRAFISITNNSNFYNHEENN